MAYGIEHRAELLRAKSPDLIADIEMYSTADGGMKLAKRLGWGCLCCQSTSSYVVGDDGISRIFGFDGWPILREQIQPGEKQRVGFVFLSGAEAVSELRKSDRFYLWEGRFIGEAVIVDQP